MRNSEPFLPFTRNLLCKRIRFDDKLDLIDKIIPIDDKTCLLIDRARNFHLKVYSPEDEDTASLQFPLPPYAHNSNPNVLYSVDYMDLYHYINKKKISENHVQNYIYNLDRERTTYIQFVYLGDSKLAVQLNYKCPVTILDLHEPKNPPVILKDVYGVKNLVSLGNGCLAWYEKSEGMVILYHSITQKRKILNFTGLSIKKLYSLKDHVIVAVSRRQIEILDYAKNKVIKIIGFIDDAITPEVVVHSEANIISYVEGRHIHIWKTDKGRIKWQNYFEFRGDDEYSTYKFIAPNLIALKTSLHELQILFFDSKNLALHTKMNASQLDEPGLEYLCCENASKEGILKSVHPLGNNCFGVIVCFCGWDHSSHGQQRISIFKLENLTFESPPGQRLNVDSIKFTISKSIIFEEFRDPIVAIDIFDDTFGMFITEKARVFRVDLKDYSVKEMVELRGLVKQSSRFDIRKIEKFFVLAEDRVVITTKFDDSMYQRIVVFALDKRTVDYDSNDFIEETEEEAEYSFYDVVKLKSNKLLLCYEKIENNEIVYSLGKLHDNYSGEYQGYVFDEYNLPDRHQIRSDRLWNLEDSLVAIRLYDNSFHLSFVNTKKKELKFLDKKFRAESFLSVVNSNIWDEDMPGILDVRPINKDVVCIQIKMNEDSEKVFLVYNIKTEELLNNFDSIINIVGTIKHYSGRAEEDSDEYKGGNKFGKREKLIIFGESRFFGSRLHFEPARDFIDFEIESVEDRGGDARISITARNFQQLKTQDRALIYESNHHKNFVCVLKSPNLKVDCLRVFQSAVGNSYHKYIYKSVFDMIFGVIESKFENCIE